MASTPAIRALERAGTPYTLHPYEHDPQTRGGRQLDLKSLAGVLGGKRAALAEVGEAERATGYVHGGISPLGQRRPLPTAIDESATTYPTIYVSAGRRGLQVELAPHDLVRLTQATVAAIAK